MATAQVNLHWQTPAINKCKILLKQSFTTHMPSLLAFRTPRRFLLNNTAYITSPIHTTIHCLRTVVDSRVKRIRTQIIPSTRAYL